MKDTNEGIRLLLTIATEVAEALEASLRPRIDVYDDDDYIPGPRPAPVEMPAPAAPVQRRPRYGLDVPEL